MGPGVRGVSRRKRVVTTQRAVARRPAPDLVQRAFTAAGPNRLWVADITYIPTLAGWLYLAVVLDVWSRRVVGWAMATHLRTTLVLAALDMAIVQRQPQAVIHHSDQGTQYTALAFGARCRAANVRPSMGSVGDCFDNAMAESFFATLECELLDRTSFPTPAAAQPAVFEFIEGWYNTRRRHSALGYVAPLVFKQRVYPGFPTLFWGLSVFFVGDLMGKALWKLVENAARFPRRGGRVLCVHGAVSFHRARPCGPRWLPGRGAMRHVELDRRVLGLQSTGE